MKSRLTYPRVAGAWVFPFDLSEVLPSRGFGVSAAGPTDGRKEKESK